MSGPCPLALPLSGPLRERTPAKEGPRPGPGQHPAAAGCDNREPRTRFRRPAQYIVRGGATRPNVDTTLPRRRRSRGEVPAQMPANDGPQLSAYPNTRSQPGNGHRSLSLALRPHQALGTRSPRDALGRALAAATQDAWSGRPADLSPRAAKREPFPKQIRRPARFVLMNP